MNIVIKFLSDTRSIVIDKNIIDRYKLSVIYAHLEVFPNANEIELDMKYEDFLMIHEMMINKINQWDLPTNISDIAHNMGLVDDGLNAMNNLFIAKKNKKLVEIQKFLSTDNSLFIPDSIEEYLDCKIAFSGNKNIIPVQIVDAVDGYSYRYRNNSIKYTPEIINIYDGIPIYMGNCAKKYATLKGHGIVINSSVVDINQIRKTMLFTEYDFDQLGGYGHIDSNMELSIDKMYGNDEIAFLRELLVLHTAHMSDESAKYLENESLWQNPPPNLFHKMPSNKTCDRICDLIKNNSAMIYNYRHIARNKKHVELFVSSSSRGNDELFHFYYVGYCCFINIVIE